MVGAFLRFIPGRAYGYAAMEGTILMMEDWFLNTVRTARATRLIAARLVRDMACDNASPPAVVILHLHSCYVSKAAILTVPAKPVPVENRSPA